MSRNTYLLKLLPLLILSLLLLVPLSGSMAQESNGRLLVWVGDGVAPGQHGASNPGQLVLMNSDGTSDVVMDVPPQTTRVVACGDQATSPNNEHFAFFIGLDHGTLYMIDKQEAVTSIQDDLHALACAGNGTFQFAPDSSRFAYLDYPDNFAQHLSPTAWLRIYSTDGYASEQSFDEVSSFDMNNDAVAFARYFKNDKNEADEVGIILFDGESDREVATLFPDEDCYFSSSNMQLINDGKLVLLMIQRCKTGDQMRTWQYYVVDPEANSTTLVARDVQAIQYAAFARTNSLFSAENNDTVFFTLPDGVLSNTVHLASLNPADTEANVVFLNYGLMPKFTQRAHEVENHAPLVSPNGRWLALVRNTPNNEATLTVIDLENPDTAPLEFNAGSRGDQIGEMVFTPDSSQLLYVVGGHSGGDNSLSAVNVDNGNSSRVRRGRFWTGALSPDGTLMALMNWVVFSDEEPPYLALSLVDINNGSETVIFEGAEIVDGEITNQQFAFPLAWRPGV